MPSPKPAFSKILDVCRELTAELPDIVFIGGVAVYLHSLRKTLVSAPPEASHDGDFAISFVDYGALKDAIEVVPNQRLGKHQMVYENIEFDIYVDRLSRLVVPYDAILAYSTVIEDVHVASLEHLLVLKLEACLDREQSSKGKKDARDIVKIGLLLRRRADMNLIRPYLHDKLEKLLERIARSTTFHDLCSGNAHAAKKARTAFAAFAVELCS
jgi:predicted nucleotidyltransferase